MQSSTDPRPVVVAVDASDSARDAAAWAADIAADWSAPLHLVHVVPGDPQDRPLDPLPGWLTTLLDVAERAGARPCTAEAQPGDLAATIAARAVGARMVVLGSYGAGAVRGHAGGHHLPCCRRAGRLPGRRGARVGAPDRPAPQRARRRRRRRLGGGRRRAGARRRPGDGARIPAARRALLVGRLRHPGRRRPPEPVTGEARCGRRSGARRAATADRRPPSLPGRPAQARRRTSPAGLGRARGRRPDARRRHAGSNRANRHPDGLHQPGPRRVRHLPGRRGPPAARRSGGSAAAAGTAVRS